MNMRSIKIFLLSILALVLATVSIFFYDTAEMIGGFAEKCDNWARSLE
jgi:hypothetical protein